MFLSESSFPKVKPKSKNRNFNLTVCHTMQLVTKQPQSYYVSSPSLLWPKFVVSMLYKLEDVPSDFWVQGQVVASWGQDVTRTRNLAGNDRWWEMAVRSEEDNTNSILDTIYKSPPGHDVRQGGAVSHTNQRWTVVKLSCPSPKSQILGVTV